MSLAPAPAPHPDAGQATASPLRPSISWGRLPSRPAAGECHPSSRHAPLPVPKGPGLLAHGLGRSYGDVALNEGGTLVRTRGLDRFMAFDRHSGLLRAEAGVSLAEVLALVVPHGWFLPVTPGTRYVTLGGAVANDVHGKNHHRTGSFGHHLRHLELLRSSGERLVCSPTQHPELLRATVGGLGLTGLITWVELQLQPVAQPVMRYSNRRFHTLDEFWQLDAELAQAHAHTVAWLDVRHGGRGIYSAADFVDTPTPSAWQHPPLQPRRTLPLTPPCSLVGGMSSRLFNAAYFRRPLRAGGLASAFGLLYPLDAVGAWNRVYGPRGFLQYQCVLPLAQQREGMAALLGAVRRSGLHSSLTVLKTFGDIPPAGLLSFPMAGTTLAMDFANHGDTTLRHFRSFDTVVLAAGGRLYPAKDAHMSASMFAAGYPRLDEFIAWVDPGFSSSFWRRVRP